MIQYKYQILFFGNQFEFFDEITIKLIISAKQLGVNEDAFVFYRNEESIDYKGNQPVFCLYSNTVKEVDDNIVPFIQRQIDEGNTILPLYEIDFGNEIDDLLCKFNGLPLHEGLQSVVNHILEGFNLLRKRRKLFISYRRSDSKDIAIQLFEYFESLNYDIFLDTHSVPKGEIFQDNLWHQMFDSDVIILLDTSGFLTSEWCIKELTFAENKRIALLRLKFPDSSISDEFAALMSTYKLTDSSFKVNGRIISDESLKAISNEVESIRARALAARQDNIITEFIETARLFSKEIIRSNFNLLSYKNALNEEYLFIPAIGVSQSTDFHEVDLKYQKRMETAKKIFLLYDESYILHKWQEHLIWLNNQLRVHALCRSNFNNFLAEDSI